jgi:serine/threonine protein kinase
MMRLDGADYCLGGSRNLPPPELALLSDDGVPCTSASEEFSRAATHPNGDMYLLSRVGMQLLFGLPDELNLACYEYEQQEGLPAFLQAVASHDWAPKLQQLRSSGLGDPAEWLAACLAIDPEQRPTPAQALTMPFLSAVAEEVEGTIAAATPGFVAGNQAAVELLAGLHGAPQTFLADQHHVHGATCSSSSSALAGCCCANWGSYDCAACCFNYFEQDSSSMAPDTPCLHSLRHSCSFSSSFSSSSRSSNSQQHADVGSINCSSEPAGTASLQQGSQAQAAAAGRMVVQAAGWQQQGKQGRQQQQQQSWQGQGGGR